MIRYKTHTIHELTRIDTNEKVYELLCWFVSDDAPQIAGSRSKGFFNTYKEAEEHHEKLLSEGLLKDD